MRSPTSPEKKWAWWEAAVAGEPATMHERDPQVGYYKVRRWPRLPFWLAARVWIEPGPTDPETGELMDDEIYRAHIDGERVNPYARWSWLCGHPITEEEYKWLMASRPLQPAAPPKPKSAR